ncbi:transposase [Microscilla marina]|uniref:Insertion element IS1 protein InsB n=1 Tax=Microscilla marina ATCC 23134 TaxID=313606 RepID=A1ZYK8_MICM2|nr:transposase [Microscilla marina]EAY24511.1 insertion element IS1 protein InsB [Microscilla marina ATCC 23134]
MANLYLIGQLETGQLKSLDVALYYSDELDKFWRYVGNKSNQRGTWYAIERHRVLLTI